MWLYHQCLKKVFYYLVPLSGYLYPGWPVPSSRKWCSGWVQARESSGHLSAGVQPGALGGQHVRDQENHGSSLPPGILWDFTLEHHASPVCASLHLLPFSFSHLPVKNLVQCLPKGTQSSLSIIYIKYFRFCPFDKMTFWQITNPDFYKWLLRMLFHKKKQVVCS